MSFHFQFDSLQAFFEMGTHGPYIWGCYALVFVVWSYLAIVPSMQTNAFFKQQRQRQKRLESANQEDQPS